MSVKLISEEEVNPDAVALVRGMISNASFSLTFENAVYSAAANLLAIRSVDAGLLDPKQATEDFTKLVGFAILAQSENSGEAN